MNDVLATIPRFTKPLTLKQERFIGEFMKDGNATRAARDAGYSEKTASQIGHVLLRNAEVAARIEALRAELRMGTNLTVERVRKEMARIAFFDPGKAFKADGSLKPVHEMDEDTRAVIAGLDVDEINVGETTIGHTKKLKFANKNQALELAAKHLGMVRETPNAGLAVLNIIIHK